MVHFSIWWNGCGYRNKLFSQCYLKHNVLCEYLYFLQIYECNGKSGYQNSRERP